MKFITVTTKDVGNNGLPKLFAINIAHIVTVEPVLWKPVSIDIEGATQEAIEGTNIVVNVNQAHVIEVASRDTFEGVMKRIELADGTVQNTGDAPITDALAINDAQGEWWCIQCGATEGDIHERSCGSTGKVVRP